MSRLLSLASALLLIVPGVAVAQECNLTGVWNSTFGRLELKQDGNKITGKYAKEENFFERITGTVDGTASAGTAEWTWSQSDKDQGQGRWTISPTCRTLDGKWGRTKELELGNWFATRSR